MKVQETSWPKTTAAWRTLRSGKKTAEGALFTVACRRILKRSFRLVIFAGLKRSGNHAFINWVLSQSPGPCVFFNHVAPDQYPTERHRREFRLNTPRGLPTVAFSYEDRDIPDILGGALQSFITDHDAQIVDRQLCLILRDPRNLMASRFRKWPDELANDGRTDQVIAQWKDYARTALSPPPDLGFPVEPVYYNAFIAERGYRVQLSAALGILSGDRGLDTVPNYGYGSSFDGLSAAAAPDRMNLFSRWEAFKDDARFLRLFEDEEIDVLGHALAAAAGTAPETPTARGATRAS